MQTFEVSCQQEIEGRRIHWIREYRTIMNTDLRTAIAAIDIMREGRYVTIDLSMGQARLLGDRGFTLRTVAKVSYADISARGMKVKIAHPKAGTSKIQTIKAFRNVTALGLREAKNEVDKMAIDGYSNELFMNHIQYAELRKHGFEVIGWIVDHFEKDLFEV